MSAESRRKDFETGPRRHVRFVYLVDVWPKAKTMDPIDAFEQATDAHVIAVLNRELETLQAVLASERAARAMADRQLKGLRAAYRLIGPDTKIVVNYQGGTDAAIDD